MTTRLIINADDYGRTPSVSRGIRYAHLNGIVTSTTCMMNMPSVVEDIEIALQETPDLGLGVHLILTAGKPLLPPSKTSALTSPEGLFWNKTEFIDHLPGIDPVAIKNEWRAQIEAFARAAGKKPTHLDSHHHSSYS